MIKKTTSPKTELRKQAEEKLGKQKEKTQPLKKEDALRIVHELRVHQIELEMQNEELMRLQAELDSTLNIYAELYAFAPVGYFTLTRDGAIRRANLTGAKMLGTGLSKLIKRRFGVFIAPQSRTTFSDFLDRLFISGNKEACEVVLQQEGSAVFWARIEAVSDSAHGQAEMCYAIVSDITERKKAEEEIQQLNAMLEQRVEERTRELHRAQEKIDRQEKLSALGRMAGSVGHELRNPLGVISNAAYFLKISQPDASDKIKEHLHLIEKHAQICARIVGDLLDLTHIKPVEPVAVSVSHLVHEALERFPAPEVVQVTLDLPADLPQVYADPQHVVQILGNLILNACQAMKDGGKLTVSGNQSSVDSNQSSVGSKQSSVKTAPPITAPPTTAHWLLITVRDTGAGIAPENMGKLFEPLFSTKLNGVGLGLVVCQNLAEVNGGRIEVESDPGKGSTFSVYLPVYKDIEPGKE
jgi:PAS domain S-box-containing protein